MKLNKIFNLTLYVIIALFFLSIFGSIADVVTFPKMGSVPGISLGSSSSLIEAFSWITFAFEVCIVTAYFINVAFKNKFKWINTVLSALFTAILITFICLVFYSDVNSVVLIEMVASLFAKLGLVVAFLIISIILNISKEKKNEEN